MQVSEKFHKNDSCKIEDIRKIETEIGKAFPISYTEFLCWSNGGEGLSERRQGHNYIYLWRCEDIPQYNKDYAVQKWMSEKLPNILFIASQIYLCLIIFGWKYFLLSAKCVFLHKK